MFFLPNFFLCDVVERWWVSIGIKYVEGGVFRHISRSCSHRMTIFPCHLKTSTQLHQHQQTETGCRRDCTYPLIILRQIQPRHHHVGHDQAHRYNCCFPIPVVPHQQRSLHGARGHLPQVDVGERRIDVQMLDAPIFPHQFDGVQQTNGGKGNAVQRDCGAGILKRFKNGALFLAAGVRNEHGEEATHADFVTLQQEGKAYFEPLFGVTVEFHFESIPEKNMRA